LKYPLNGQQETEIEPFHSHHKTQAIFSHCGGPVTVTFTYCHCQYVIAVTYNVVNTKRAHLSYIYNCKTGFRVVRSAKVTANR